RNELQDGICHTQERCLTAHRCHLYRVEQDDDLAVLKIEKSGLTAAKIGDSSKLVLGQTVVAIGNPGGIEFAGSVTSGIISGLDRKLSVDSVTMTLIQTDAAINPGNSGGALVDASGCLVGVPNVKISADGYEGMGFCIPVNTAVEICNDIIKNGMNSESNKTPYLGVEINNSFTGGAYVARVTEGGPAEDAGIKSGDIIISFGNDQITGYNDLIKAINSRKPGDTVAVGIYRNGSKGSVTVTLGSNGN
ncbi:MAG: trypsin-like peptidase domain-containing protein, partial [Clostridia bacterium]|nr:trypsin-like peptidase domain-containing protein [Clostridia bacterium]